MDPIELIKPTKDTTLAMLLEGQRRGWRLHYMEKGDLYLRDGEARASRRLISVEDSTKHWFDLGEATEGPLADMDLILMRSDPPVDDEYLYATWILERAEQAGSIVMNRPASLREVNEKLFTAWFNQCTPPTMVTSDGKRIRKFLKEFSDIIIKPLNMMGGASVFRLQEQDANIGVIIETMTQHGDRSAMVQKYLPEIIHGDKRILMIDGEPLPYALARVPLAGETRGNLAAGGTGEGRKLTERDRWIASQVGPTLKKMGLYFVGLDIIGDYLTEINVTSPTCVRELDRIFDLNIARMLFDVMQNKLRQR